MRIATVAALLLIAPASLSAQTHKFKPTAGVQTFAVRPPVLTVKPGDTVETETFSRPGDYYDPKTAGPWPGEVGPFPIEGAAPGDTLVVRILKLAPNRDVAISNVTPNGISGVAGDSRTRMLNDPLPARRFVWQLDRAADDGHPRSAELAPASASSCRCGRCWAASPSRRPARKPGAASGRATSAATSTRPTSAQGATIYLPVFHPGALFYFGDFHALQGDGEIVGSGLESTADVTFQFDLIKGKRIRWPRIENDEYIMVAGSIRPLIDALRIAYVELIDWLVADYGFDKMEAYQIASQAGVVRVANVVDPNYTVIAKFPKRFLPPKNRELSQARGFAGSRARGSGFAIRDSG